MNNIIKYDNDEIDLKDLFRILFFNKRIIASITLLFFILGIFYSFTRRKVYQGEFQIVLDLNSNQNLAPGFEISGIPLIDNNSEKLETEIEVLKSPLVLSEVFSFVNASRSSNNNTQNLTFKKWRKKSLNIELEKRTTVLNIYYKDYDKEIILPVLNQISTRYQEYSKRDRNIEIIRTLEYLNSQKNIMEKKSQDSFSALNKFSIENGLGSRDTFVGFDFKEKTTSELSSKNNNFNTLDFNQRFESQFKKLEEYESQYMDLSADLKSNSRFLVDLQNKIESLRKSLKKPNDILVKYNDLKQIALRDNYLFNEVNVKLGRIKLEEIKTPNPWELITSPTLNQFPIAPRKKILTLAFTLSGFILSSIFIIFRDKLKGVIYSINDINGEFDLPFITELSKIDEDDITETFFVILKNAIISKEKIGLISIGDINDNVVLDFLKIIKEKFNKINITFTKSFEKADNIDKFILVSGVNLATKNQLNKILKRLEFLNKINLGLIILKDIDK